MAIDPILATRLVAPGMARTVIAQLRRKVAGKKAAEEARQAQDEAVFQESMALLRNLLKFCCHSTVEDLHVVTGIVSPPPPWVRAEPVDIPSVFIQRAAELVQAQLGSNLDKVGTTWWQWRKAGTTVKSHWVEMKADYEERKARNDPGTKVIFYVHGGAYYLGGIGHDMQVQRHARKLKGRCFAPRYRLAPEFPFPCAIHDIVSAYLYLLTVVDPSHVVIAGDSAGGGLCLALLLIIRDQGLPMPAGASLISPWVDLTHSFPSITAPTKYDYVPNTGFHAKHSMAWPPPPTTEMAALGVKRNPHLPPDFVVEMDGQPFTITEQINMYAQNLELIYPLVSPIHAASLGGFCPCQVLVGGGEVLRDEQIYLAHKLANPQDYELSDLIVQHNGENPNDRFKHPPTDVELLIFDDGPHAAPTLGHIDVAKFQYRAIAQFAATALARAQNTEVEIEDFVDDYASEKVNQVSGSQPVASSQGKSGSNVYVQETTGGIESSPGHTDDSPLRAGYPLPPLTEHMNRYRVSRQGKLYPMEPPAMMPCLNLPPETIGLPKGETLGGWIRYKDSLDKKFASDKKKVNEKRIANAKKGYVPLPNGEIAPPTALVGRRVIGEATDMEVPAAGLTNSLLAKLFRSVDSKGAAPNSSGSASSKPDIKVDGGEDMDEKVTSARRSSRIVRPGSWAAPAMPAPLRTPGAARGLEGRQQRPFSVSPNVI